MSEIKYDIEPVKVPGFNEANGFYTTRKRSELMSKIRSVNSKPEQILRKALWNLGLRYRKNVEQLPGKPDLVIKKYKLVVFVDGEFWHGYKWEEKKEKIKANRGYWVPKIERNMQRDEQNREILIKNGYVVLRFWEHEVKKDLELCIEKIFSHIETFKQSAGSTN